MAGASLSRLSRERTVLVDQVPSMQVRPHSEVDHLGFLTSVIGTSATTPCSARSQQAVPCRPVPAGPCRACRAVPCPRSPRSRVSSPKTLITRFLVRSFFLVRRKRTRGGGGSSEVARLSSREALAVVRHCNCSGAWHSALVHFVTSYSPVVRKRDRSVSPSLSWGGESSVNLVPSCALRASGSVSLLPRLALCPSTLTAGAGAVPFWYARDWLREAPLSHQRGDEGLPQPIGLKLVS